VARVYVGTSGYSYDDWVGPFYPPGLAKSDFLSYYDQLFNTVEINSTYYRMPTWRTMRALAAKVRADFRFAVKAHSSMTHERSAGDEEFGAFRQALAPLIEEQKLAAVLAQFPWSFRPGEEAASWLHHLARQLAGLPTVVEFRNRAWISEETFALLEELGLGFCCVDEPRLRGLMPPIARATAPIGYVRFHGRNAQKWWQHEQAWERYDYLYSREELREWVPKVRELAERAQTILVFFNNHYQAQAVQSALLFRDLLAESGLLGGG
jgi:uncharacterized protein YecE (DUF72 family)